VAILIDLRSNTIRWLCQTISELQKRNWQLEQENARLKKNAKIRQQPKTMAAKA
jgi:hypothetical protein